jgi:transcriptional regulator with PAS, ATPase and Fis domain
MDKKDSPSVTQDIKQLLANDPLLEEALYESSGCGQVLKNFLTVYEPLVKLKREIIPKLSTSNLSILILGETGTGKEMIAESIHAGSGRVGKFVPVNCSGIPSELLESEFFGCVKGAYTGAITDRNGYVKEADNGTLFLDEIGDMPSLLQAKILRLCQSKRYRRVGSSTEDVSNFRLVTATNKFDIESSTSFRLDLYYRIAGSVIKLPNLAKRGIEDIKLIVKTFSRSPAITEKILEDVTAKTLKGNVRELLNIIEEHNVLISS